MQRGRMNSAQPIALYVDDDPNDAVLLREACRKAKLNLSIEALTDGDQAIAYLSGEGKFAARDRYPWPVLMLLDLKMPRKNGFEVLTWIRSQRGLKRLPVIILTSSRHEDDIQRAYDLGANSYLVKPVGFEALVELVKTVHHYWLVLNVRSRI